ncbi:MAG: CcdB family protein [Gammaproteobacteria bacterium]|nr:CcdB family protein [Gammaproteobacteria bacterium]
MQSDSIADLDTRLVVPPLPLSVMKGKLLETLPTPVSRGRRQGLRHAHAAIGRYSEEKHGPRVADLAPARDAIVAALDMLITGI